MLATLCRGVSRRAALGDSIRPWLRASRLGAFLILGLVGSAGCGPGAAPGDGGSDAGGGRRVLRVAVIPKGTTHTFWKAIHAGARQGARQAESDHGVEVKLVWQGPLEEGDREGQRSVVETFAGQANIAGIVLAPVDDHALVPPVEQAVATGKPVVIIDSGLKGSAYASFIATNNRQGGVLAAQRLGELLGGKGKVLLLRYMVGSASTQEREQGFIDTLREKFPAVALVPPGLDQYSGDTVGRAQNASEALLNAYPDVDGIFTPNESSTTGMLEAIAKTGRAAQAKFVGFDANDKLIEALASGRLHGLVLQDPVGMASTGVQTLVRCALGKPVEKRVETLVSLATAENMKTPPMQRLLKPDLSILGQ